MAWPGSLSAASVPQTEGYYEANVISHFRCLLHRQNAISLTCFIALQENGYRFNSKTKQNHDASSRNVAPHPAWTSRLYSKQASGASLTNPNVLVICGSAGTSEADVGGVV